MALLGARVPAPYAELEGGHSQGLALTLLAQCWSAMAQACHYPYAADCSVLPVPHRQQEKGCALKLTLICTYALRGLSTALIRYMCAQAGEQLVKLGWTMMQSACCQPPGCWGTNLQLAGTDTGTDTHTHTHTHTHTDTHTPNALDPVWPAHCVQFYLECLAPLHSAPIHPFGRLWKQ